ncbi:MAG: hypothetical protein NC342_03270 [Pseudoflavonifractor sp.]|nr:hypothetical protein [Alloprevotella sp.]MCM1116535.1 hypothetical protein [Pseudoflavonifractor sp.]
MPKEPVREKPLAPTEIVDVAFYGLTCQIRVPDEACPALGKASAGSIADRWELLSGLEGLENTIRDCLETRIRYGLCDWAYLQLLDAIGSKECGDRGASRMLTAWLFCQSGYAIRLGLRDDSVVLLFGTRHQIYGRSYFPIDGLNYYPYAEDITDDLCVSTATFDGEQPLSLAIGTRQDLGEGYSEARRITVSHPPVSAESRVSTDLIRFYDTYPASMLDDDPLTRWALYADTPASSGMTDGLYPQLRSAIAGMSGKEAAGSLLYWMQVGFEYEYDDEVWGHDRAFFAEETLYYPYADCEDRAILFSRLVRDLTGLDVALIYYPGHLATAVAFDEEVEGDAMELGGRRFVVCDPTYIGAPVGAQMPGLEYEKARAIVLRSEE